MSDKLEFKRADVAMDEATAEFIAKKTTGKLTREEKEAFHALRVEFRTKWRKPPKNGAAPEAINTKVGS